LGRIVGKVFPVVKSETTPVAEAITPAKENVVPAKVETKKTTRKKAEK
jgi:hypothetical protein